MRLVIPECLSLQNRFQGHADFPLTVTGRAQALALAARWHAEGRSFDQAFSSPLARARETAEIISAALDVPVVDRLLLRTSVPRSAAPGY